MQLNQSNFLQFIGNQNLPLRNTTLLIAVSGGVDSLALLHILVQLREQLNIILHIATLDHALRDDSADDLEFVRDTAQKWQVPFIGKRIDVQKLAQSQGIGIEAAGRQARYDFLAATAQKIGTNLIATAHHADDQTETILMHILRGSGTKGLVGMQTKSALTNHQDLFLVRPLLTFRRHQIEAYCNENGLKPRIDQSNFNIDFLRNHVRHDILPRLREINPQFDSILNQLADIVSVEQDFMQQEFEKSVNPHLQLDERVLIPRTIFQKWHPAMQRRAILFALSFLDIEANYQHIEHAIRIALSGNQGAIAQFSGNAHLRVDYDMLKIEKADAPLATGDFLQITGEYNINIPDVLKLENWKLICSTQTLPDFDAMLSIPIGSIVKLRTRKAGDRFKPMGLGGRTQKLKKWLIDHKIPRQIRDGLPILTIDGVIAAILLPNNWVIAEKYIVTENSQYNIYFKAEK